MEKTLPKDVELMFTNLFTLIGESLIDEQIQNRKEFEKAQNDIGKLLKEYNVKNFEYIK